VDTGLLREETMRRILSITAAAVLFVALSLPVAARAVQLVSVSMARDVSSGTIPEGVTDTFGPDAPAIHCVAVFAGASERDTVKAVWVAVDTLDTPNYEIDATSVGLKAGEVRAHFKLGSPDNGWPVGNYKLLLYINGTFVTSVPFKVVQAGSWSSAPASPGERQAGGLGLEGSWQCRKSYMGQTGGQGTVVFDASGTATVGGRRFSYSVLSGNVIRFTDQTGANDYAYELSGERLVMRYSDGSTFDCVRGGMAGGSMRPGAGGNSRATAGQGSGSEWQLQGTFCHWSGSSSSYGSYSSYSSTSRIFFDGRGRWSLNSEASFSGEAGSAYSGGGNDASGTYRVAGDRIQYMTSTGEQGVATVNIRQADGRITEIYVDGELYSTSLCN